MGEEDKVKKFTTWDFIVLVVLVIILFPFLLSVLEGLTNKNYETLLISFSLFIFTIYGIVKYAQKLSITIKTNKTIESKEVLKIAIKIKTDKFIIFRKLFVFLKKYLGEIFVVIGSFIAIYNSLNFNHITRNFISGLPVGRDYYYTDTTKLLIAIGIALIITGIFIIRKKSK